MSTVLECTPASDCLGCETVAGSVLRGDMSGRLGAALENYEISPELRRFIEAGISTYPDFPYHNQEHGVDVVENTADMLRLYGKIFDKRQGQLLLVAAAWHDAGYGADENLWGAFGGKEEYACHLLKESAAKSSEFQESELEFMIRAIMGTKMSGNAERGTPEARLLHLADLGYLFSSDRATFKKGVSDYREEEHSSALPAEFRKFELGFLDGYAKTTLESLLEEDRINPEEIKRLAENLAKNRQCFAESSLAASLGTGAIKPVRVS